MASFKLQWLTMKLLGVEDEVKVQEAGEDRQYRCDFSIAQDEGGEEEDEHGSIL